jgi:hypothetical protein
MRKYGNKVRNVIIHKSKIKKEAMINIYQHSGNPHIVSGTHFVKYCCMKLACRNMFCHPTKFFYILFSIILSKGSLGKVKYTFKPSQLMPI